MHLTFRASLSFFIIMRASLAVAGAWVQPEGSGQLILTASELSARTGFDSEGDIVTAVNFDQSTYEAYGEYGLQDDLTFIGKLIGKEISEKRNSDIIRETRENSLEIGLRQKAYVRNIHHSAVQLTYIYDDHSYAEMRWAYGNSFKIMGLEGFTDLQTAYLIPLEEQVHRTRHDLTLGADIWGPVSGFVQVFEENNASVSYTKAQSSILISHGPRRYQVGRIKMLRGQNFNRESGWYLGVWRDF